MFHQDIERLKCHPKNPAMHRFFNSFLGVGYPGENILSRVCFSTGKITEHQTLFVFYCLTLQETVPKYKVRVDDGKEQYDETIEVNTEKNTETFHIPSRASSSAGEADVVFDFTKVNH